MKYIFKGFWLHVKQLFVFACLVVYCDKTNYSSCWFLECHEELWLGNFCLGLYMCCSCSFLANYNYLFRCELLLFYFGAIIFNLNQRPSSLHNHAHASNIKEKKNKFYSILEATKLSYKYTIISNDENKARMTSRGS